MKRAFRIGVFLLFAFVLAVSARAEKENFTITITGNLLLCSDSGYKDIYGSKSFYPEIKAAYKIYKNFYIWGGYGFLSDTGRVPVIDEEARTRQDFFSAGIEYQGNISKDLGFRTGAGLFYVSFKEEAMDTEESGSTLGFRIDGALFYPIIKNLFAEASLGYMHGSDKVNDISIKLGGFKAGLALMVRF